MKNEKTSLLGRSVGENFNAIIGRAFALAPETVKVTVDVPKDFVRATGAASIGGGRSQASGALDKALTVILPTAAVGIGQFLGAEGFATVALAAAGGGLSAVIKGVLDSDDNSGGASTDKVKVERLKPEDIKVKISVDEEKINDFMANARRDVESLCRQLSAFENTANSRHNIALDRKFGEWVQQCLIYCDKHSDNRNLQRLRDGLIAVLAGMRIKVYDEVKLKADGTPDVPLPDYLIDNSPDRKTYTRVSRPAIYSDETVLARGEIS